MSRNTFLIGLAVIVLVFLAVAGSRYNPETFGAAHDDALYLASAKSIAEGRGYRLASVPGEPPQTKYPPLYSALLSLVWRVDPEFPRNLHWAWALNLAFAGLAVLAAGGLARQLGASRLEALALTALTALHPYFVYWSNTLVSDLLFTALALGAVTLAQRDLAQKGAGWSLWAVVAALLGLACLTRTVGVAFVAGVAVAAAWRGAWIRAATALAGAAPVAWGLLAGRSGAISPGSAEAWPGFRQNLVYYTSYVEHWRESVSSWTILEAQVEMALTETLKHPAIAVFQLPATGFVSMPLAIISIAISIGIGAGIVLRARKQGLHPIHVAALFYLPIVLLWNYLLMGRFWLPFLTLFFAGASHELVRLTAMARASWRKSPAADRVVIGAFGAALVVLGAFGAYRGFWRSPQALARIAEAREQLAAPKLEAYGWLRAHSDPSDAVISYDDAALFLYAGRRGMRAVSPATDSFFAQDESLLERDLARLTDTAAAIKARYWLTAPDDFDMTHAPEQIRARMARDLAAAPVAFRSDDGRVTVHDVSGMPWNQASKAELQSGERP